MKILLLVNWYVSYDKNLKGVKQAPEVYVPGQPYWFFKYWPQKAEVDVIDCSPIPIWHWLERRKLKFYIWQILKALPKLSNYDLILSHGAQSGVLLAFLRSILKSKMPPHIIIDVGCFNGARNNALELAPLKIAAKSLAGVITHTSKQSIYYQYCLPDLKDRHRFVPFGTDPEFFKPLDLPEEDYILCVGYMKRDWETLLAAFSGLQSNTTLKLVGAAGRLKLPAGVAASKKIECLPYVPIKELKRIMAQARLVVLPLPYQLYSFGQMSLLQAMAMGKAVIVSNVPGIADYVQDGQNAVLVRPYDYVEMREKIDYLIKHPPERARIGGAARKSIEEKFNEKNMAEGIHRSCHELISH
jgi:glycosyltransferase involved in cell wall biosynthesis